MVFYLLDDIKKKLGRQLYSILAVGLLSIGTLVLGGVLIFNIVHEDPVVKPKQEGVVEVSSREKSLEDSASIKGEDKTTDVVINGNSSKADTKIEESDDSKVTVKDEEYEMYKVDTIKRP